MNVRMKMIGMLLAMIFGSLGTFAQVKNDLARQHLKGKVRSVTELEFAADGKELKRETVSDYNDSGRLVSFKVYSGEHALVSNSTFIYDNGLITEERRLRDNGSLVVRVAYKYDDKGNKAEESNYDAGSVMFMRAAYKYDIRGYRMVTDSYNEFGSLFHKSNYRLDKDGNDIEEREYDSHHGLQFTTTWSYSEFDASGNWLKRTTFKNGKVYSIAQRIITLY